MIKIDLGCGSRKTLGGLLPGYIGLDRDPSSDATIVCDINQGIPLQTATVDEVFSRSFLEHVRDPVFVLREIYRVMKKQARTVIAVPLWSSDNSFYTSHTNHFSFRWFKHNMVKIGFRRLAVNYQPTGDILNPTNPFKKLWQQSPEWCVRHLNNVCLELKVIAAK